MTPEQRARLEEGWRFDADDWDAITAALAHIDALAAEVERVKRELALTQADADIEEARATAAEQRAEAMESHYAQLEQANAQTEARLREVEAERREARGRVVDERVLREEAQLRADKAEQTAEQRVAELRATIDGLDCTRREGGDALHCRHDQPCLRCRLREVEAERDALKTATEDSHG